MRGEDAKSTSMFSYVALEDRIPADHPLRDHRKFLDTVLRELSPRFEAIYSRIGRPSIPPEQLLRALVIQLLYTIRSERLLMEQLHYNLLFRWFVGLGIDDPVWVPTVFSKNRDRLLEGDIAKAFLAEVVEEANRRNLLSDEHFTVDGTLMEAWASQKSFKPKDTEPPAETEPPAGGNGDRNPDVDWHKQKRSNETHASTTDPDARLAKKGQGQEAKLSYQGNVLMDNRHGIVVDAEAVIVGGTTEVDTALAMLDRLPESGRRRTVAGDKGFDQQRFVSESRERNITPHVAQNTKNRRSAIDGRTTRHSGYNVSQIRRKLIEQGFGWGKTIGLLRQLRHRGCDRVDWVFTFTTAVYDMVRIRTLARAGVCA
ncbi:MAG: IS5 family transposase [Gammaproteobacteria bacterium]